MEKLKLRKNKVITGERFSYKLISYVDGGGSGDVYKAYCKEKPDFVAIKFFLPAYQQQQLSLFYDAQSQKRVMMDINKLYEKEYTCLSEIHHTNIVRVIDRGVYMPAEEELVPDFNFIKSINFFVMDFIPGHNLDKYLLEGEPQSKDSVVYLFLKICEALMYLHETKQYMHMDIRPSNIRVREGTVEPVLIDLALYKNFNFNEVDNKEITGLDGDWDLFPKEFDENHILKIIKEKKKDCSREELKKLIFPALDLYQLGLMLSKNMDMLSMIFPGDELDFLGQITSELTSWEKVIQIDALWLVEQFSKLKTSYSHFMGVEELTPPSSAKSTLQLPRTVVSFSEGIDKLLNTKSFRRLRSINQLALIDILYPGAGYKRHLHSLNAYHYCKEFIMSLSLSPKFRLIFDPILAKQALGISLIHDINHFPLLHIFQEAGANYGDFNIINFFCDGKATQDDPSIYNIMSEEFELEPEQVQELISMKHHEIVNKGYNPGLQIIKSLIDSGADIDKIAYLGDDSYYTGVPYGQGIDIKRLIANSTIVNIDNGGGWHIGFREKAMTAVESLVMARYWMFRTVYWHRVNRGIMSMLLHVIKKIYVESKSDASVFIADTMWKSEEAVLEYLNERYRARFGCDAIVKDILKDPKQVYQRLFSLHGASNKGRDSELYNRIESLSPEQLEDYRISITYKLNDYLNKDYKKQVEIKEDDILIDLPRRRLDTAGPIYIELDTGYVRSIDEMVGPIQTVANEFEKMVKRLRIFVHPEIREGLDEQQLVRMRSELQSLLEDALPKNSSSQVK